ncbi:MAG: hypothetical protein GWP09_02930, partial [Nitrospiraceae bacterium]|nr:hypothetical protein [Nitrospiraceae bacterium]
MVSIISLLISSSVFACGQYGSISDSPQEFCRRMYFENNGPPVGVDFYVGIVYVGTRPIRFPFAAEVPLKWKLGQTTSWPAMNPDIIGCHTRTGMYKPVENAQFY